MLLRHTTATEYKREALTINPAKTCQPIGAMYCSLGVHGCLPHSHGSQGCCSYHRSTLTRHYKEPVMAATSSFTEGASVFGGQANLLTGLENIFSIYDPDIVAVHSTCLSETIGDDLHQIIGKARDEGKIPLGKHVIPASTPSYVGSHVTGYSNMLKSLVSYFPETTGTKADQLNILAGWMEPSDYREIKRLVGLMGLNAVVLPDTSGVLDTPLNGKYKIYPDGGTTIPDMVSMGDSWHTIALGEFCTRDAAIELENKSKVRFSMRELPIGLQATDRFIKALRRYGKVSVTKEVEEERGRLVDVITDMHQYFYGKRVALFGDPDQLVPLTQFLTDCGMKPVYIISGTPGKIFVPMIEKVLNGRVPEAKIMNGERADLFQLHQWIKQEPVDLLIGNTYGKYIARDEKIPFVRYGFPILDRVGHSYFPSVGYLGGIRILEKILGALMDKIDATCPESKFELVM